MGAGARAGDAGGRGLTIPPPGPAADADSGYPNVAVTIFLPSVVTEQVGEDPEQAPPTGGRRPRDPASP